jgi:hypothetical protein
MTLELLLRKNYVYKNRVLSVHPTARVLEEIAYNFKVSYVIGIPRDNSLKCKTITNFDELSRTFTFMSKWNSTSENLAWHHAWEVIKESSADKFTK